MTRVLLIQPAVTEQLGSALLGLQYVAASAKKVTGSILTLGPGCAKLAAVPRHSRVVAVGVAVPASRSGETTRRWAGVWKYALSSPTTARLRLTSSPRRKTSARPLFADRHILGGRVAKVRVTVPLSLIPVAAHLGIQTANRAATVSNPIVQV